MKLRLPVRLKLAVLAELRSVVQATLASGFLAVGAVFFSFSAQAEDEDEAAVPVDDEAPASGLGVSAAELNDSQAAALAEAEQEHAAELGINATSSAVSQAAIEAQDAAVSPAQAAGGSHADSFAAVPAADSPALTLPAAEGAIAPSLCAEGAADFVTDYAPIKTASVAVLPQASTSLTLSEDVVMASSPVAEAAQTSSSSTSAAAVSSSSSSGGGAVACGGGAAGGGGGSSASFSASVSVTDVSSSGSDLPSDSVVSAEDPALSPSEPSPSLPDDSELVDSSPSSDSSSLSDAASLSSSLSASASTTGASSSSPAARSFSLKLLGATATSEANDDSGTSETVAEAVTISTNETKNYSECKSASSITLAGGTLVIDEALQSPPTITASAASTVQIQGGRSLASGTITFNESGAITLTGSGTYTVSAFSLGTGVSLGDTWTGTVRTSATKEGITVSDLSGLANSNNSSVELYGVSRYWQNANNNYAVNLVLTNPSESSPALKITDGYSDKTYTFSGSVSGEGTFELNKSTSGIVTQNYTFSGDISKWTGIFKDTSGFSSRLTFSGLANNINVQLKDVDKLTLTGSSLFTIANSFTVTGNVDSVGVDATRATGGVKLSPKSGGTGDETGDGTETICSVSQAFNAGSNAVTVESGVKLTVSGLMTAGAFTNSGTVELNGGAGITGTLTNTGSLTFGGAATVGKIDGSATVTGALTLTGVDDVYHSGGALFFGEESSLTLGTGTYEVENTFNVGNISGSILNDSRVSLAGLAPRQNATYSADTGIITIGGYDYKELEWNGTSVGTWDHSTENWVSGSGETQTSEHFYNGDSVSIGAYSVTTSGALQARDVLLAGTTLTIASGSSLSADSISISGTTTIDNQNSDSYVPEANSVTIADGTNLTLLNTNISTSKVSGSLTVGGNSTLTLTHTGTITYLTINGGTVVTTKTGGTAPVSGTVTVNAGGTYKVSSSDVDGLGYDSTATRKIILNGKSSENRAVLDLSSRRSTATTLLYLNGWTTVETGTWDPYGTNNSLTGGTITVSGTENVISAGIRFRADPTFSVEAGGEVTMSGNFDNANNNAVLKKQGAGLLIITSSSGVDNAVSVEGGTLRLAGEAGKVGTGAITLSTGTTLELAHTQGCTLSGNIVSASNATQTTLKVNGDRTETLGGTVFVTETDIQQGTLSLTGSSMNSLGELSIASGAALNSVGSLSVGAVANAGTMTIGAKGSEVSLTLGGMLKNSGVLTINGNVTLTFAGELAGLNRVFKDALIGENAKNGFAASERFYLISNDVSKQGEQQVGGILTLPQSGISLVQVNGEDRKLYSDSDGSLYFSATAADISSLSTTYFINEGTVVYGATDNSAYNATVTELCLTGGTLELASWNLDSGVSLLVTGNSTVAIGEGRTLSEEVLTVSRGALTLTGSGTYRMAAADFGATAALTDGVVPGADASFTGTVWLSSGTTLAGTNLSGLTSGASSVTLNGVSGYLNNGTISTNLVLTNDGAVPALAINNGTNGDTRTFSGSISGTGTMARTNRMNRNDTVESGETQNFKFTGDIAGWTGVFDNQVSLTTNLTFGGEATTVNATLKYTANGGVLNVSTEKDVIFNGGMSVTSLTAGENSTITLNGNSKVIGGVQGSNAVSGSFVVGKGGSLTVGDAASLTGLTVMNGGSVTLNGTATATGKVTVSSGGYLALGTNGLTLSGSTNLTLENGAIVALQGWTATTTETIDYLVSGVYTTGYSGGVLFTKVGDATGSTPSGTNVGFTVVKDGASFTGDRVTVNDNGTVTITNAVFYNVASNDTKTVSEATGTAVDYINVLGTLTGVNDTNIASLGVGASDATGVYGDGTLSLVGKLTDGYHLSSFSGTIDIGTGSTFETNGNVDRRIELGRGTGEGTALLKVTENATLSSVTITGTKTGTIDVAEGKSLIVNSVLDTSGAKGNLIKEGAGTLSLAASVPTGPQRNILWGDLTINRGEVILYSAKTHGPDGAKVDQSNAVVRGNIVINAGGTLTANGIDPLGFAGTWTEAGSPNCTKKLTMNGSENAYAVLNIASGQHVTLSTAIYMNGYSQINGRYLNAWSSFKETTDSGNSSEKNTAYIYAESKGNVINADFYLRHHALFEVGAGGELSLNGNILKLDDAAYAKPIFRKSGEGTLILDSPTATTLYNLRIENGEVRISTDLSFAAASALDDFSMTDGSSFTVVDDGRFTYGGWTYEMKDGSSAKATVTAGADTTGALLSQGGITIANTKLTNTAANTNTATNTLTISAKLAKVAFTQDNSGYVTIANADGTGTQHLSSLAVNAGSVTLNNAQLDAAKVASGATLNFTKGTTIALGSTIQNAGTVALTGTEGGVIFTIDLNNLSGFDVYGTDGYSDAKYSSSSDQDAGVGYNGFYKGQTYYLVKNAGGNVELSGATITGAKQIQTDGVGSIYFTTSDKDTKYYINNSSQQDTNYKYSADAENSMYGGYLGAEDADHFATSGIVMDAENGRLILATNLREDEGNAVSDGIIMRQAGSITVESGVTLKQSSLKGTANATLKGAGIYKVGSTALWDIAKGFTVTAWTGTVQVSGAATEMKLSYMGHAGSTVQMTGVHGTLEDTVTDAKTYAMDIALVNGAYSAPALEFTANNGSNITFSGAMSGGGNMKLGGTTAQTEQNITFSGDMSNWTGAFEAGQGTVNLTLTGNATEVNAGILRAQDSTLNLIIDGAANRTLSAGISVDSLVVTEGAASGDTRIALAKGGWATMVDLTAEKALLQVQEGDKLMAMSVNLSENGGSGINIADGSGNLAATIRTNVPTTSSAQSDEGESGERVSTSTSGTITNAAFSYDSTNGNSRAKIEGMGTAAIIDKAVIDVAKGSTLELSNVVLTTGTWVHDEGEENSYTGNLVLNDVVGAITKSGADGGTFKGATVLTSTGPSTATKTAEAGAKIFKISYSQINQMNQLSGKLLTLDFDSYSSANGMGFAALYKELQGYDYVAVVFDNTVSSAKFETLEVQSQITNGQGATATSTGYYNATATSGVVVYFDALALPEPTTSTLALLALTALCARRRRPQPTR